MEIQHPESSDRDLCIAELAEEVRQILQEREADFKLQMATSLLQNR